MNLKIERRKVWIDHMIIMTISCHRPQVSSANRHYIVTMWSHSCSSCPKVFSKLSKSCLKLSQDCLQVFQSFLKVVPNLSGSTFSGILIFSEDRVLPGESFKVRLISYVDRRRWVDSSWWGPTFKVESLFGLRCWQEVRAGLKEKVASSSNRWDSNASPRWR